MRLDLLYLVNCHKLPKSHCYTNFSALTTNIFMVIKNDISATPAELEAMLGEQLRAERLRKNLTMDTVAEMAGVSVNTLRSLEAGQGGRVESLIRVVRALGKAAWLESFRPAVTISPLQIAQGKPRRQRATRTTPKNKE
jgi:hypothetical protein